MKDAFKRLLVSSGRTTIDQVFMSYYHAGVIYIIRPMYLPIDVDPTRRPNTLHQDSNGNLGKSTDALPVLAVTALFTTSSPERTKVPRQGDPSYT